MRQRIAKHDHPISPLADFHRNVTRRRPGSRVEMHPTHKLAAGLHRLQLRLGGVQVTLRTECKAVPVGWQFRHNIVSHPEILDLQAIPSQPFGFQAENTS